MAMKMEHPEWLAYPGSSAKLELGPGQGKDEITILCNPQGLASIAGVLLWVARFTDPGGVSISALPFVKVDDALALSVVMTNDRQGGQGRVKRMDKDRQFEWQIYYEELRDVACDLYASATHFEYVDFCTVWVTPDSDVSIVFRNAEST